MSYIILVVGFILLIKGADLFVDGSASIAKKLGIPSVIVGLTIVSLGTSAPELAVSLISSLKGSNEIAIGNVVGSNLFNALIVLGITAIITPLLIDKITIKKDFLVNNLITILLFFLTFDSIIFSKSNLISRVDGIILLVLCIAYMVYLVVSAKKGNIKEDNNEVININIMQKVLFIIIGILGIIFGGKLVVDSATTIAYSLGMSEKLVGLTIVAMGTSLPELVTSVVAVLKGENEIALGNVLGSNTFNILLILGASAVITPIPVSQTLAVDFIVLIGVTLLLGFLIFFNKEKIKKLTRTEGLLLVAIYVAYTIYIVIRN
ncbi:calcium/sodium antiporter [Clostridium frigidicarnis]|uniref:Cation:H+ antiporter n=1 Tax=Clostridium frigidicarnis TaxID=84698 RepID=A0A1I0W638_9CLOT|nr:calcium/sodium antiporter [Clostridium frigidicarnis]SFA84132.1 cation:H+ antiporter [Clostridium frigidicarnis]